VLVNRSELQDVPKTRVTLSGSIGLPRAWAQIPHGKNAMAPMTIIATEIPARLSTLDVLHPA